MKILTEMDISGAAARHLRERAGLSQAAFWKPFGLTQSCGCRYETSAKIPKAIRSLVFLKYVAEIEMDLSTAEGARSLIDLGRIQASDKAENKKVIGEKIQRVMSNVREAKSILDSI